MKKRPSFKNFSAPTLLLSLTIALLSGCNLSGKNTVKITSVYESPGYTEYELTNLPEFMDLYAFKEVHEFIEEKLAADSERVTLETAQWDDVVPESYSLPQPYLGGFNLAGSDFWLVESGREYVQKTAKEQTVWTPVDPEASGAKYELYRDGVFYQDLTPVLGQPLCYGFDGFEGMIKDIRWVDEKLSFTYLKGRCVDRPYNDVSVESDGVRYNLTDYYELEEGRHYFEVNGKKVFIGKKNGQEFIYLDGLSVTQGFDAIPTSYCCATPRFFSEAYQNGKLFFIGKRAGRYYLIEVDSQTEFL